MVLILMDLVLEITSDCTSKNVGVKTSTSEEGKK